MPTIGAHVSTAGGLYKAVDNGQAIGAHAIQIFGASPRQWAAKQPLKADITRYKEALKASDIRAVFLHAAYLVNIASSDQLLRARSIKSLLAHLQIAESIEAQGLIFHVGSGKEQTREDAIKKTVESLKTIFETAPGSVPILMENAAGGGAKIGAHPSEFGTILNALDTPRLRVCIDTAHSFEAGLIEHFTPANVKEFVDLWDKEVGMENVLALHANDSKTLFNSRNDRHENIGEGHIGLQGFKNMAKEKRLAAKPWLLEVPGFEGLGPDKKNVDILKSCFS